MEDLYKLFFGEKPRQKYSSPLKKGDHPELDTTAFLEQDKLEIYQSLIGAIQWSVSIRRWDIQSAVMTMSSFRAQQRYGYRNLESQQDSVDNIHIIHMPIQTEHHPHSNKIRIQTK
jgi:hypothetical protein